MGTPTPKSRVGRLAVLAALIALLALGATLPPELGVAMPRAAGPPGYGRPPKPIVTSHGHQATAGRGSYCWFGGGHGICVDYYETQLSRRTVRFHPGDAIEINARYPAQSLSAQTADGDRLPTHRVGRHGRRWTFAVPERLDGATAAYLFIRYDRGDGYFGLRLDRLGTSP